MFYKKEFIYYRVFFTTTTKWIIPRSPFGFRVCSQTVQFLQNQMALAPLKQWPHTFPSDGAIKVHKLSPGPTTCRSTRAKPGSGSPPSQVWGAMKGCFRSSNWLQTPPGLWEDETEKWGVRWCRLLKIFFLVPKGWEPVVIKSKADGRVRLMVSLPITKGAQDWRGGSYERK